MYILVTCRSGELAEKVAIIMIINKVTQIWFRPANITQDQLEFEKWE